MVELHKHLSDTAIKLSVYSSILDFGLALSVAFIPKGGALGALVGIFTVAITYVTLVIIAMFFAAFVLKHKENVIKIYSFPLRREKAVPAKRILVQASTHALSEADERKAVLKVPQQLKYNDLAVQHVINSKNESFVRFNGIWYKSANGKFEQVARPDYE